MISDRYFEDLVNRDENTWLEFKSYWYWDASNNKKEEGWNELLKDLSAMFNTRSYDDQVNGRKYIIFGYDEKTRNHNNYREDRHGNDITDLIDINQLKDNLVKKLKSRFLCYPLFKGSSDLYDIESILEIKAINYKDTTNLVLIIHDAPYLLQSKSNTGKGTRSGDIWLRKLKSDKTPENDIADHAQVSELLEIIRDIKLKSYPEKETTILKVVEAFRDKNLPGADIISKANERSYTTGICYEIYSVESEFSNPIYFLYFTKYTSQNKTFDHIKNLDLINKNEKVFILLDTVNKKGGKIDIDRISYIFKEFYKKSESYYIENFSLIKLYEELFNNDVFYKGQTLNKNFIKPYTEESSDKTADLLINEWYTSNNHPLLVLKGSGGCGKTTVVKNFIKSLYSSQSNINVLYINSHEIINDIMKMDKIEDIFDFYSILATKNNLRKKFNKKLLALSSDNGNLVVVLDGIDEVIAKKGSDFDLNALIESIFNDYSGNLNKTKVIITCRDFFWDESQNIGNLKTLRLKPFDQKLAEKYFAKVFNNESKKIRQSMAIASDFKINDGKDEPESYIPYILDMIKENIVIDDNSLNLELKTEVLQYSSNVHDYLVAKSCEREIIKLDNLEIDEQIKIFNRIAIEYDGILNERHLENILDSMHATKNLNKFKDHPLLVHDNGNLSFRYDFFATYFKCLYLYSFFANEEFDSIDSTKSNLLIRQISFGNEFTLMLKTRLGTSFSEKLKEIILFLVNNGYQINHIQDGNRLMLLSSALFILLLDMRNELDKNERTNLMREIYEKDGYIENLSIVDLHSDSKNIIFDFKGMKFNNCLFNNYDRFSECTFDEHTIFKNTVFKPKLSHKGLNTNISNFNIDFSTCNTVGLDDLLEKKIALKDMKKDETRRNVKRIISYFWNNGYFTDKLEREAKNRFKNIYQTFENLCDIGVILAKKQSTSQKRQDTLYYISDDYLDLRKIFEENNSCYELESIIKKLESY
ncbi:ATP-binding protein [Psychrobacter urativorans]|uniref:ATPase domain-containing protein n=1 Tax=Psychrobacter urativorans TaxID=45610 RepID=A0A0M5TIS0_9GAMM|nr:ATP-binding protein [Psychrobacter urativorans]ALF58825.1 hypothetical protein AOC03_01145 [Psychrobacter urativorans]